MPEQTHKSTTTTRKSSVRRVGIRMSKAERAQAQEIFLAHYALNGNIMLACRKANIDRATHHWWCEHEESFSLRFNQAKLDFADFALAEFRKRAMEGYEKPLISMGRVIYEQEPVLNTDGTPKLDKQGKPMTKQGKPMMERVVSDNLLAMLIKRHFPEFREKQQIEHSGPGGGPLQSRVEIVKVRLPDNGRDTPADTEKGGDA